MSQNSNITAIANWRKSSYSNGGGGECLEVADGFSVIPVRDSKEPQRPMLVFGASGWSSFVTAVKDSDFSA